MLIIKILLLLVIIFIALLLIVFSESVHISITLKNNNLSYFGVINIKYYFFQIVLDIKSQQAILMLNSKYFTKKITTITRNDSSDETELNEDNSLEENSEDMDNEDNPNFNKQLLKLIYNSKKDIIDLIILIIDLFTFKNSYILMNLGLGDNNLTIKTCNKIWAITAPFYTIGLQTILTPELNETVLKTELNILFELTLLKILKIIKKVLLSENLREILVFYIKSSD